MPFQAEMFQIAAEGVARPDAAETMLGQEDFQARLRNCIGALPLQYRAILVLRDFEKLGIAQTANLLGISEAVVKTRHNRARLALTTLVGQMLA